MKKKFGRPMDSRELKKHLRRLELSVPQLAAELGVHESTVYRWLDDSRRMNTVTARWIRAMEVKEEVAT